MSGLSERERERYTRQLVLPAWGEEAQLRLKAATAFVAGAGGLGSAAVLYLAAAGVGCIRVCDRDTVELSNLNRQILHTERGIGGRKAASARQAVARLNKEVRVVPLVTEITEQNVGELAAGADILLDCLDNVPARLVVNRLSVSARIPLVHAGVRGLGGQLAFLLMTAAGSVLVSASAGYWRGIFDGLCPDVALLSLGGRPNVDGEPYQGSSTQYLLEQVQLLRPARVALCHHDPLFPGLPGVDIEPAAAALRGLGAGGYFEMEYATPVRLFD